MYNAVGLLKKGPRCYVLDSTDPAKLAAILDGHQPALTAGFGRRTEADAGGRHGDGHDLLRAGGEPARRLAALYDAHNIDSRPNFLYMTLPGSLARSVRVQARLPQNRTATRRRRTPPPAAIARPLTRGSLYPLGLCRCRSRTSGSRAT